MIFLRHTQNVPCGMHSPDYDHRPSWLIFDFGPISDPALIPAGSVPTLASSDTTAPSPFPSPYTASPISHYDLN